MSKINPSIKKSSSLKDKVSLAGGFGTKAAKQDNYSLLRRITLANLLWEDNAYVDGVSVVKEMERLIPLCEPNLVAQLAVETRVSSKLRHTPLKILVEMCKYDAHKKYLADIMPKIITRADMLTDFLAIYWKEGKKPICNQAKKGLAKCFHNFDEYQFAKYDREGAIKIRDVMFLCRPKPNNVEERKLFKKIADRTLETPMTWEVLLSSGADKRKSWEKLIADKKIGGLALLRNISNMVTAKVPKNIISNAIRNIKSTMIMPLDYLKAMTMNREFETELNETMIASYSYLPKLKGNTLIIVDISGSMGAWLSSKSMFSRLNAACSLALLAIEQSEKCKVVVTSGNDGLRKGAHAVIKNPNKGFGLMSQLLQSQKELGMGGIFTRQCLEWCRQEFEGEVFDRIIVFSDSQDCDYPNQRTPNPFGKHNYICDISSEKRGINYKGKWTAEISGFSENFLSFISICEGNSNSFELE